MRDAAVIEQPAESAIDHPAVYGGSDGVIGKHAAGPFLLYLAHTMPHVPLFASREFAGRSPRGVYGDVVEEIDWSDGQVVDTLREARPRQASDCGVPQRQRTLGALRRAGRIRRSLPREQGWYNGRWHASAGDTLGPRHRPTGRHHGHGQHARPDADAVHAHGREGAARIAPSTATTCRPSLRQTARSPRETMFFYRGSQLYALGRGRSRRTSSRSRSTTTRPRRRTILPCCTSIDQDPGEQFDIAARHPEVIARIRTITSDHARTIAPVENQLIRTDARN